MRNLTNAHAITLASLASLASITLAGPGARAAGYAIPASSAREVGLSQATVAAQTGPEAVYQNVAALAGHDGFAISASLELLANKTTWTSPVDGSQVSTNDYPNFPPEIAVSYGSQLPDGGPRWAVGAALVIPGGGALHWPADWPGSLKIQKVDQKAHLMQFGGAVELYPGVKIGATVIRYRVTELLVQKLNFLPAIGEASIGLAGDTYTFGLAGEFKLPTIPLVLGIDYRHKGDIRLKGNAHFDNVPASLQATLHDQPASEDLVIPNELFIGAAYHLTPDLQVMGAWTLERWVVYKSDTFVGADGFSVSVPRGYHNGYVFRFGVEWDHVPGIYLTENVTIRVGFQRSVSPQPSDTISPSLSDGNSTGFSIGTGYEFVKGLRADVAYQLVLFDSVTASGPAFPGSYSTTVHFVTAGLTYRFGQKK
jgi:long-chain fatty acid transport protein